MIRAESMKQWEAEVADLKAALTADEARAQRAEADVRRYRWLRVQRNADIAACWYLPAHCDPTTFDTPEKRDAAIDAAIDAALAPEPERKDG